MRKQSIQSGNIATVEDSPDFSYISVVAISTLGSSWKGTTSSRTRRHRGDLEWEVECIVKSEIITYVRRRLRMQEIRYFVKWARCSEDENT